MAKDDKMWKVYSYTYECWKEKKCLREEEEQETTEEKKVGKLMKETEKNGKQLF